MEITQALILVNLIVVRGTEKLHIIRGLLSMEQSVEWPATYTVLALETGITKYNRNES